MKKPILLLLTGLLMIFSSCSKEKESERFSLLTAHLWTSESLLADGVDASGPGQVLEKFKGNAEFKKDGTGTFGQYTGTWHLTDNDTNLAIDSPDLPFTLTTHITELTTTSLKVAFQYPGVTLMDISMAFKPK